MLFKAAAFIRVALNSISTAIDPKVMLLIPDQGRSQHKQPPVNSKIKAAALRSHTRSRLSEGIQRIKSRLSETNVCEPEN